MKTKKHNLYSIVLLILFSSVLFNMEGYSQNLTSELKYGTIEGGYSDAVELSANENIIVVYISGAKGRIDAPEKISAKQYGERLVQGFNDPKYSKYPTEIVVIYNETDKERPTVAQIIISGKDYLTESGHRVFTPIQIGNNIDLFTSLYLKK